MASFNKVLLMGNLTRDPELRYTTGGLAVCSFGLAANRSYTAANGQTQEEVCFVDLEAWGKQGELCNQYLRKGSPALIEGRLRYESWDDRATGQKRNRLLVRVENVQFLGSGSRQAQASAPPDRPAAPGPQSAPSAEPSFEDLDDVGDSVPF